MCLGGSCGGEYQVGFTQDVSKCSYYAADHAPTEIVLTFVLTPRSGVPDAVYVETHASGVLSPENFSLAVIC
jgi:hypothetical protein